MSIPSYLQTTAEEAEAQATENQVLENNGFFPTISLHELEECYQIDDSYNQKRRLHLLRSAMAETNTELLGDVCKWQRKGYYSLHDVPQEQLGDQGVLDMAYQQAVYAKAMELLNERYRAADTTKRGAGKAEVMEDVAEQYEKEYRRAIYTLTGRSGESIFCQLI